jgi:hypothetical protein
MDLFPSSGEGEQAPVLLKPSERISLSYCNWVTKVDSFCGILCVFLSHEGGNWSSLRQVTIYSVALDGNPEPELLKIVY